MKLNRFVAAVVAVAFAALMSSGLTLAAGKPAPTGKVNLNTATAQQLTTLPGVGEKLAGRILEYRQKSGGFKSAQELLNVKGIGEKNFAKLSPYVSVGEAARAAAAK